MPKAQFGLVLPSLEEQERIRRQQREYRGIAASSSNPMKITDISLTEKPAAPTSPYELPPSIQAFDQKFTVGGIEYTWNGSFGRIFSSLEKELPIGTVRMVGGIPFYVQSIYKESRATFWNWLLMRDYRVSWTISNDHLTTEWIKDLKKIIFR